MGCKDIDESDTPHVALTLQLEGLLWTGDKKLKEGLIIKGFDKFFEPNNFLF
ncbi:PIN domain-containing protein [Cuspidothrix issatschenkoi]|uniref:PIN domain-containing protein n=1 Tax=Cuspidothrix issatschenkoi TaxID=230752 RepID=UPI002AD2632F|nr:PIN domain-containing protein [Cuspidothrix issatschenkoi]